MDWLRVWMQRPPHGCIKKTSLSPALPWPNIVLMIICIQCVLVQYITVVIGVLMHSISYRLTQLNGLPCLICSGSFILILKGHCKYSMTEGWKEQREKRVKEEERKRRLDPPFCSYLFLPISPLLLSLFSLMSVLSIGSQCKSVAIIYTHTVK